MGEAAQMRTIVSAQAIINPKGTNNAQQEILDENTVFKYERDNSNVDKARYENYELIQGARVFGNGQDLIPRAETYEEVNLFNSSVSNNSQYSCSVLAYHLAITERAKFGPQLKFGRKA